MNKGDTVLSDTTFPRTDDTLERAFLARLRREAVRRPTVAPSSVDAPAPPVVQRRASPDSARYGID